jgi:hypothetical protein
MKMEQSVPKRWHIKFGRQEITQKKNTTFTIERKNEFKNNQLKCYFNNNLFMFVFFFVYSVFCICYILFLLLYIAIPFQF